MNQLYLTWSKLSGMEPVALFIFLCCGLLTCTMTALAILETRRHKVIKACLILLLFFATVASANLFMLWTLAVLGAQ